MSQITKRKIAIIADSHEFFRQQYHRYLHEYFNVHILEKIEIESIEKAVIEYQPDIIIIDAHMETMKKTIAILDERYGWLPILVLSDELAINENSFLYGIEIFNQYQGVTTMSKEEIQPEHLAEKLLEIIHKKEI